MKHSRLLLITACWLLASVSFSQVPTLINYQGRLLDGTNLVNATVSMDLTLFSSPSGGGFQYVDTGTVVVVDGLYSTFLGDGTALGTLTNALAGTNVYVEIAVNGVTLSPRERLASVAYAVRSSRADLFSGAVSDSQLSTNISRLNGTNQIFSAPVVFNSVSNTFTGTFSGNGAGVTNVNLATINAPNIIGWGAFVLASSPAVGLSPKSVAAADVNGDGRVDLISAGNFTQLLVLTNNGSGAFFSNATYNVGSFAGYVATADVNGDGKVDLISANVGDHTLSVLTNNGSGVFFSNGTYSVDNQPTGVAAADVTGDGKVDLISVNFGIGTLSVLTNNGSGTFVSNATYSVGREPQSLAAADVTGDGKVDLISANTGTNTLMVLTNNGSGAFFSNATYNVGLFPYSIAAADVNGDGRMDLVSANAGTNTLSVLTNNGSGSFTLSSSPFTGASNRFVVAVDVNGDGRVDLISAKLVNGSSYTLAVLTNNGSGLFTLSSTPDVGYGPDSLATADVNGDGKVDVVSANFGDSTLSVLFNAPIYNGSFNGDGSGLVNAAGWVRSGTNISYSIGNVGIGTTSPTSALQVAGTITCVTLNQTSDRNKKENFAPVDADEILGKISALQVSRWNFKGEPGVVHLGPMAQDFRAAFQLGQNDVTISAVDADGVALAAIQALAAENAELKSQLDALKARLDAIEAERQPPN